MSRLTDLRTRLRCRLFPCDAMRQCWHATRNHQQALEGLKELLDRQRDDIERLRKNIESLRRYATRGDGDRRRGK